MSEEKKKVSQSTIDNFMSTTDMQDYVLKTDVNPFDYTTRFVEAVVGKNGTDTLVLMKKARRKLYNAARDMGAVAVVGLSSSISKTCYLNELETMVTNRVCYVAGMAVIPKSEEELRGDNDE